MSFDTWLGVFGAVTGVIGLVTGYIFYRRGVNPKRPCWNIENNLLIQDHTSKISKLEILYNSIPIRNVSVASLTFWNDGPGTLDGNDITSADPLCIVSTDNTTIHDVKITHQNNTASKFAFQQISTNMILPLIPS